MNKNNNCTSNNCTSNRRCSCIPGPRGPQGIQGIQGVTGPQGLQGIQGIQGETGPQGLIGLQGIQGETGPQGLIGIQGETGPQGLIGIQGETGPQGQTGTVVLSNLLTSITTVTTVPVGNLQSIRFGNNVNINGTRIQHITDTTTFALSGGETYQVIFSVNGVNTSTLPMIMELMDNGVGTNTRIVVQNVSISSGMAIGYITTPTGAPRNISIENVGANTIESINGNISILQITNNVTLP